MSYVLKVLTPWRVFRYGGSTVLALTAAEQMGVTDSSARFAVYAAVLLPIGVLADLVELRQKQRSAGA